jgi:hypothetical protein
MENYEDELPIAKVATTTTKGSTTNYPQGS